MSILRRLPVPRLLLACAAIVIVGATATAFATSLGSSPKPPPAPSLAAAVHDAVTAPAVPGVSARIQFTNHLIDTSSLPGSSPVLGGASGRLWASNDGKLRLELQSDRGDGQIVYDGNTVQILDGTSNTLYRAQLAHAGGQPPATGAPEKKSAIPTVQQIQDRLTQLMTHATLSDAIPSDVAGRPAYTVRISPSHDGGLIGAAELAWDSQHGVPLRLAIFAQGSGTPVLELKATDVTYGAVDPSQLTLSPPAGTKVVDITRPSGGQDASGHASHASVSGVGPVQAAIPFKLSAPDTLATLPRQNAEILNWGGSPAALVTYGKGLGGIAVIERQVKLAAGAPAGASGAGAPPAGEAQAPAAGKAPAGHGDNANPLPQISIPGPGGAVTGTELATALGTIVRFERAGVSYMIIGSIVPRAAEDAARGL